VDGLDGWVTFNRELLLGLSIKIVSFGSIDCLEPLEGKINSDTPPGSKVSQTGIEFEHTTCVAGVAELTSPCSFELEVKEYKAGLMALDNNGMDLSRVSAATTPSTPLRSSFSPT
jgi:hypothetical protein